MTGPGRGGKADARTRHAWVVPPASGTFDGLELSYLDPSDPDDRRFLILAEHPELRDAIRRDVDEVEIDGLVFNPRLHIVMHEVVANQIWDGDPIEVWRTAQRLATAGYERHEILHMLGSVVAEELWYIERERRPFNRARYLRALRALPASWERRRT